MVTRLECVAGEGSRRELSVVGLGSLRIQPRQPYRFLSLLVSFGNVRLKWYRLRNRRYLDWQFCICLPV